MSNLAKDWQEGTYVINVSKNTVKVTHNYYGLNEFCVEAQAKCDPKDEFSLSMGVALAMDRLNKELSKDKIEVGDKVKIKDGGLIYDGYVAWVIKNIHDIKEVARYAYCGNPDTNYSYEVIAIAPHSVESEENIAYIKKIDGSLSPCYLISIDGLEKV